MADCNSTAAAPMTVQDDLPSLPDDALERTLRIVDAETYETCRMYCGGVHGACSKVATKLQHQPLVVALFARQAIRGVLAVEAAHRVVYADSNEPDSIFSKQSKVRLKLFVETASFLKRATQGFLDAFGVPFEGACVAGPALMSVTSLVKFNDFLNQVRDALIGMEEDNNRQLGDAFDMADLALWRYCFAFEERCENAFKPAAMSIKNTLAREWWTREWGAETYSVSFTDFYMPFIAQAMTIQNLPTQDTCSGYESGEEEVPEVDTAIAEELHFFLRVFLNFPEDDVMTTYKFNLLDQALGPMTHLVQNFRHIVLRSGFVGLVNRETANEMIGRFFNVGNNKNLGRPIFLLRFSRTKPGVLVATVGVRKPTKIDVTHRLLGRETLGGKSKQPVDAVLRDDIKRVLQKKGMGRAAALPIRVDNASAVAAAVDFRTAGYDTGFQHTYIDVPSDDEADSVIDGGASVVTARAGDNATVG